MKSKKKNSKIIQTSPTERAATWYKTVIYWHLTVSMLCAIYMLTFNPYNHKSIKSIPVILAALCMLFVSALGTWKVSTLSDKELKTTGKKWMLTSSLVLYGCILMISLIHIDEVIFRDYTGIKALHEGFKTEIITPALITSLLAWLFLCGPLVIIPKKWTINAKLQTPKDD